jgi:hypothetical protein
MTTSPSDELGEKFASLMVERDRLYMLGRVSQSNKVFMRAREVAAEIMRDRASRAEVFGRLLDHACDDVVIAAASYMLPIDEPRALRVLRRMEDEAVAPGHQITALYCQKEWKAGRMDDIRALA